MTFFVGQGGAGEGGQGAVSSVTVVTVATTTTSSGGGPHPCEELCEIRTATCPNKSLEGCISTCRYRHDTAAERGCFSELDDYDSCWLSSPCNDGSGHPTGPDPAEACYESDIALSGCSYAAGCFISATELHTQSDGQHSCFGETDCEGAYQWTRCSWFDGDALASCECFEGNVSVATCQAAINDIQTCTAGNCCLPVK